MSRELSDQNLHHHGGVVSAQMHQKRPKILRLTFVSDAHLSHIFEVVVPLLQGAGSVQGLAHAGVLAEEGLAVVLDPVYHLGESKKRSARLKNLHRRLRLILLIPAACIFF